MKGSKSIKLLILSVALTLTFLLSYQFIYAYFTTQKQASGNVSMGNLDVTFAYQTKSGYNQVSTPSFEVIADKDSINRGDKFGFKTSSGETIDLLFFHISADSCDCYIRFFINAYLFENNQPNTSVNYGQYFQITGGEYTRQIKTNGSANAVYYYNSSLSSQGGTAEYKRIGSEIQLLADAPNVLLNSVLQITITFDAVQSANKAFMSEFNDGWGYLSTWE